MLWLYTFKFLNKLYQDLHFSLHISAPSNLTVQWRNTLKIAICTEAIKSFQLAVVVQHVYLKYMLAHTQIWKADISQCRTIWLCVVVITWKEILSFRLVINLSSFPKHYSVLKQFFFQNFFSINSSHCSFSLYIV